MANNFDIKFPELEENVFTLEEIKSIEKHCLSRQRVREAIEKLRKKHCALWQDGCKDTPSLCDSCSIIEAMEKELGLDEETKSD